MQKDSTKLSEVQIRSGISFGPVKVVSVRSKRCQGDQVPVSELKFFHAHFDMA
jgi:hypothetical protein